MRAGEAGGEEEAAALVGADPRRRLARRDPRLLDGAAPGEPGRDARARPPPAHATSAPTGRRSASRSPRRPSGSPARSSKAAARALDDLRLDLTFTAHPTEATRWSVMQHAGDVSELLARARRRPARRRRPRAGSSTASASRSRCGGRPPRSGAQRPQVDDEVRRNLHYFDRVLFDAVPELVRELERCFGPRPLDFAPLRFSSWAGGDMDGHPGVTAATFTATVDLHRRVAVRLLRDRVERLASRYSQSETEMGAGRAALEASLRRDGALMPEVTRRLGERRRHEPRARQAQLHLRAAAGQRRGARQPARLPRRRASCGATSSWCATRPAAPPVADGAVKDLLRQVERVRAAPRAARRAPGRRRDRRLGPARRARARPAPTSPSAARILAARIADAARPTSSARSARRPRRCTRSAPPPAATARRRPTRS